VLPFLAVGESTTVVPSPPRPSSEDAVPGTEALCLEGMLGQTTGTYKAGTYLGVCPMVGATIVPVLALLMMLVRIEGTRAKGLIVISLMSYPTRLMQRLTC
jgi:hypothetical protein